MMLMAIPRSAEFDKAMLCRRPALVRFAISLTRDEIAAEDLAQETMVRAMANHSSFELGTSMDAWLFTIAKNLFFSDIKKRKREAEDPEGKIVESVACDAEQEYSIRFSQVLERMRRMPKAYQEALRLVGHLGFSYEAAARQLGVPIGTIKSRVNRAKALMNEQADLIGPASGPTPWAALDAPARIALLWRAGLCAGEIADVVGDMSRSDVMQTILAINFGGQRPRQAA